MSAWSSVTLPCCKTKKPYRACYLSRHSLSQLSQRAARALDFRSPVRGAIWPIAEKPLMRSMALVTSDISSAVTMCYSCANSHKKSAWKIRFNADADAFVPSASHPDNLINRQVRYQSKTIHYGIPALILALAVYIFHVILAALPIFFWTDAELFYLVGSCLGIKIIADAVFLLFGSIRFKSLKLLLWFPILEILIIPYIVIICALGTFTPFKWK